MMSARASFDGDMYFGEVVCPLKGKRLDAFRQDYRLLAMRINERVGHLGIHMFPDLLFYGRDIKASDPKARLFYGESELPDVGAFFYIYGRILRVKEPFVPKEGDCFANGRIGHEGLYRLLQLKGYMAPWIMTTIPTGREGASSTTSRQAKPSFTWILALFPSQPRRRPWRKHSDLGKMRSF